MNNRATTGANGGPGHWMFYRLQTTSGIPLWADAQVVGLSRFQNGVHEGSLSPEVRGNCRSKGSSEKYVLRFKIISVCYFWLGWQVAMSKQHHNWTLDQLKLHVHVSLTYITQAWVKLLKIKQTFHLALLFQISTKVASLSVPLPSSLKNRENFQLMWQSKVSHFGFKLMCCRT